MCEPHYESDALHAAAGSAPAGRGPEEASEEEQGSRRGNCQEASRRMLLGAGDVAAHAAKAGEVHGSI